MTAIAIIVTLFVLAVLVSPALQRIVGALVIGMTMAIIAAYVTAPACLCP